MTNTRHHPCALARILALAALLGATPAVAQATPLTIGAAVRTATRDAATVELARIGVDAARAMHHGERADLLPDVQVTAGYANQTLNSRSFGFAFPDIPGTPGIPDQIGPFGVYDARIHARQTLFDLAAWKRYQAGRGGEATAQFGRQVSMEVAATAAAVAYLDAARAVARVAARTTDVRLARELVRLAQQELDAGLATAIDLTRARTRLVEAARDRQRTERDAERAQIALARRLGRDPATRYQLVDSLTATMVTSDAPPVQDAAVQMALAERADLQAAGAQQDEAITRRGAIQAERLPRLALGADWGVNGPRGHTLTTGAVSLQVSVPIVSGLGRSARIAEQDARARAAAVRAADLREQVVADVSATLLTLTSGQEALVAADELAGLAQDELDQARARFTSGIAGNLELINAQIAVNHAADAQIDARYATAIARVELARAVGVTTTIH